MHRWRRGTGFWSSYANVQAWVHWIVGANFHIKRGEAVVPAIQLFLDADTAIIANSATLIQALLGCSIIHTANV